MQLLNIVFLFLLFLHYVYHIDWMTVKLQQYVTQIILISFIVSVLWNTWLGWEHYIRSCYLNRAIFVWPWQMVAVSVCYLFYQPMEEKIKTWPLCFPTKEKPNMEKALFYWPIMLQYDVKEKYRLISGKFRGMKFFHPSSLNQPKATCICILSINQSNRFISGRLLFLFCSCVFISRSYENRSNKLLTIIKYDMKNYADGWLAFSRDHSSFSYKSWGQYYYYCILNFISKYFLASGKYLLKICLLLVAQLELQHNWTL